MNKKIVIICVAFTLLTSATAYFATNTTLPVSTASASTTITDGDFKYDIIDETEKTAALTSYKGSDKDVVIPSSFVDENGDEYTVTVLGQSCFYANKTLVSVTIPATVTEFEHGEYVDDRQFYSCSNLETVIFEEGCKLKNIGNGSFDRCENLTEINLPETVTKITSHAFDGCKKLSKINLENIQTLGSNSFKGCSSLKEVSIATNSEPAVLGTGVFSDCKSLESVYINTKEMGSYAFSECTVLSKVEFTPSSAINTIEEHTFYHCTGLKSINLPESVEKIGSQAFDECSGLVNINLENVKTINSFAFNECKGLQKINLENAVTIGAKAFYYCSLLNEVKFGEDNLVSVGGDAFLNCKSLLKITIPASATDIGDAAFGGESSFFSKKPIDGFTIYGYAGTAAEVYANENGLAFIDISTIDTTPETYCDLNGDGKTDVLDMLQLKKYLLNAE